MANQDHKNTKVKGLPGELSRIPVDEVLLAAAFKVDPAKVRAREAAQGIKRGGKKPAKAKAKKK